MKKFFTAILMIYILFIPFVSRMGFGQTDENEPINYTGLFVLLEESPLRISIDWGWGRDGRIPVILAFRDLEIGLRANAQELNTNAGIETRINEILVEDMSLPFKIYEQNPMRTRLMLAERRYLQLRINQNRQVEFFLGGSRLKLNPYPLRVKFEEIETVPGKMYQLTFFGPNVSIQKKFVFMPLRGVIYAVPAHSPIRNFYPEPEKNKEWSVWAIKSEQAQGKPIFRKEIK